MGRENGTTKTLLLEQVRAGAEGDRNAVALALMQACEKDVAVRNTLIELIEEGYIDGVGVFRPVGTSEPTIVFGALQLKLKGRIALRG